MNSKKCLNKIVFLDAGTLNSNVSLEKIASLGELIIYDSTKSEEVEDRIKDATIIITNKVVLDKEILNKTNNLKLICIAATGMNNVDLDEAAQLNIKVKNVVGYSTSSVVQHTFALVTNLLGSIKNYQSYTSNGQWCTSDSFTCQNWNISEINSKRWGIIGLGTIGKKTAQVAEAFGAEIFYYSTSGLNNNSKYTQLDLKELLKTSDIISIHAPLNENTTNLLNKENLKYLKENSVLVNVGRGGIINEDDLLEIVQNKNILIGLDVLESEPMLKESTAYSLSVNPNIIITPHIAWASFEAQTCLIEGIFTNISEFIS